MKRTIFIPIFLLFPFLAFATNRYFANAGTDGGSCALGSPCKTITYLNTLSPAGGDTVKFNCGDVFTDTTLRIVHGGSSSLQVVYTFYGIGPAPIISGLYKLTGFTNVSGNIWTAPCLRCRNATNFVTYNGRPQGKARTPNSGYYANSKASGTTYITDSINLTGTPNYTGAELVLRNNFYTITRNLITSQSVDTIRYTTAGGVGTANGWGYFIQGLHSDIQLDTAGEWWYDSTTHLMHVYTADTTVPFNVAVIDTLVDEANVHVQYITFIGINFQGANKELFQEQTNTHTMILRGCNLSFANDGIAANNVALWCIKDTFAYINNNGISFLSSSGEQLDSSYIHDIGMIPGMGIATSGYEGLSLSSSVARATYNTFLRIGYDAMAIKGPNDTANYNFVDSFCNILNDGAAIYWYENNGGTDSNKMCVGNVIINGISSRQGTVGGIAGETGAVGIYTDQYSTHVHISGNTISNCSQAGVYMHAAAHIFVGSNNLYNNGWTQIQMNRDNSSYPLMRFDTVKNNNLGAPGTPSQYLGTMWCLTTIDGNIDSVGIIDSNNYIATTPLFYTGTSTGSNSLQSYSQWGTATGTDFHSGMFTYPVQDFRYNASQTSSISITPPVWSNYWMDLLNTQHLNYTLPKLSSIMLFPYRFITPFGFL